MRIRVHNNIWCVYLSLSPLWLSWQTYGQCQCVLNWLKINDVVGQCKLKRWRHKSKNNNVLRRKFYSKRRQRKRNEKVNFSWPFHFCGVFEDEYVCVLLYTFCVGISFVAIRFFFWIFVCWHFSEYVGQSAVAESITTCFVPAGFRTNVQ